MKHISTWFPDVKDVAVGDKFLYQTERYVEWMQVDDISIEPVDPSNPYCVDTEPRIWAANKDHTVTHDWSVRGFFDVATEQDKSMRDPDAEVVRYLDWS